MRRRFALLSETKDDSAIHGIAIFFCPGDAMLMRFHPAVDLLRTIYSTAVKFGGEKEYDTLLSIYKEPATPQHELAAMLSLASTRDEVLIQRAFDLILSGEVREQNVAYFINVSWPIVSCLVFLLF
jgi:ERAP1-like C-terminal domain